MSSKSKFYKDIDEVAELFKSFLDNYSKSKILQKFAFERYQSFIIAQLINNFFLNLTSNNVKEEELPTGYIGKIKSHFKDLRKKTNKISSNPFETDTFNKSTYTSFKKDIKQTFPQFIKITQELEKGIDYKHLLRHLRSKKKTFETAGTDWDTYDINNMMSLIVESHIKEKGSYPKDKKITEMVKILTDEAMPGMAKLIYKEIMKSLDEFKEQDTEMLVEFMAVHIDRWSDLLDLMNYYIALSEETGEKKKNDLVKSGVDQYKHTALIKIHARSIQISREIHHLLEGGFADGAMARWRSLYELSIVAMFLSKESDEMSERYLDHEVLKASKNAHDYKLYYKKLGYEPLARKTFADLKKDVSAVKNKHGEDYKYKGGYEWVPKSKVPDQTFKGLEKYVGRSSWRPFYNMASDTTHAGAKGFYRIGLWDDAQYELLLTGRTDHGLEDPIQNTAITLGIINMSLLNVRSDFENILMMRVLLLVQQLIAKKIQKSLEDTKNQDE